MKKFALSTLTATLLSIPASAALADAYIGQQLNTKLSTLVEDQQIMAVVTFEQMTPLAESQIQQLLNLGITEGVQFKSLPIIGVMATRQQLSLIHI